MQVIRDTTILGQVKEAIMQAEAAGEAIQAIVLTRAEMDEFMASEEFNHFKSPDSHYGAIVVPVPTKIETVREREVISCYYRGIRIHAVPSDPVV